MAPTTDRYFVRSKPKNTSKLSRSRELAARPWQVSADLVRLDQ